MKALSTECTTDLRELLVDREGVTADTVAAIVAEIDYAVWYFRENPEPPRETLQRLRERRNWLESVIEQAEALQRLCDRAAFMDFPRDAEGYVRELRQQIFYLQNYGLAELAGNARMILPHCRIPRGRPIDMNRAVLEWRIGESLHQNGVPITTASDGTFGRILNVVYAEVGIGQDARDPKAALKRVCSFVPPWIPRSE